MDSDFVIHVRDEKGTEYRLEGETLKALQEQLAEIDYDGPIVRVTDDAGFTKGWVSATSWRYQ